MGQMHSELAVRVSGMTCHSCEQRVEAAISGIEGVREVKADHTRGRVSFVFDPETVLPGEVLKAVDRATNNAGYIFKGLAREPRGTELGYTLLIAGALIGIFLFMNAQGWFNFLPSVNSTLGLGMIFVAGLLTSVHCVAMCGGIAVSQQAGRAQGRGKTRARSVLGGLQYHAGRIVSYTLLGGIVGAVGSVLSFSPLARGILAGIAGLFMVAMGLQMLGLLPRFGSRHIRLPGMLSKLGNSRIFMTLRKGGPFFVGLLNGFMPCGPLQTMQLYALGTGSAALGALSMFLFSLGTVPLMFLFGALSGFFSTAWQHRLVRASAVLVVFFGLVMAGRALDLSGASGMIQTMAQGIFGSQTSQEALQPAGGSETAGTTDPASTLATIKDGVQYAAFDLQADSYAPITVQKGIPLRWTINATPDTLNGCNSEIQIPQLGISKKLEVGANVIEFTPDTTGIISYTCWMGMISSTIQIVDTLNAGSPQMGPSKE